MKYPHLFEVTALEDEIRVYETFCPIEMLTDEEKEVLFSCREYRTKRKIEKMENSLKEAKKDFEKLRDIPNMPEEAIEIVKNWAPRDEDYEKYEYWYWEDDESQ